MNNREQIRRARHLRRAMTEAEIKLWSRVRRRQVLGFYFRRQAPIGKYIVDFLCHEAKLIIELDGGQHAEQRLEYDLRRAAWLAEQGFRVLRFWNFEVFGNLQGVMQKIEEELTNRGPSP